MLQRKVCISLIVALALTAAPAVAQQQEQHHPAGTPPAAAASGMSGGAMAGAGDMPMMDMMRMMMGRDGMAGMSMMDAMAAMSKAGWLSLRPSSKSPTPSYRSGTPLRMRSARTPKAWVRCRAG